MLSNDRSIVNCLRIIILYVPNYPYLYWSHIRRNTVSQSILSAPHFHNEEAAYRFIEARVWPKGPVCPHCGGVERNRPMTGKTTRIGAYKCYDCRKPFTVKVGTIFESSHIALRLWLQAIFLIASSKKGISSNQLHRTLGVTLKSAWFMSHRIRLAMHSGDIYDRQRTLLLAA